MSYDKTINEFRDNVLDMMKLSGITSDSLLSEDDYGTEMMNIEVESAGTVPYQSTNMIDPSFFPLSGQPGQIRGGTEVSHPDFPLPPFKK